MSILYVVATPIGNLEDVTLRALRTLRGVSLIAAEDTRKTRRLLDAYDIKTPLTSYFEHNKLTKLDYILSQLDAGDIALVSEAGMPGVSDPGYELVKAAVGRGKVVVPVPGPSAVTTALAVSGLPTDSFIFVGFLPRKSGERRRKLGNLGSFPGTLIFYEAPHRLGKALSDILEVLGDRQIAICRELTKLHEEVFRGTVKGALAHFTVPRGEFTLVIEGSREKKKASQKDILGKLNRLCFSGIPTKKAISQLAAESGFPRKELYQCFLKLKESDGIRRLK